MGKKKISSLVEKKEKGQKVFDGNYYLDKVKHLLDEYKTTESQVTVMAVHVTEKNDDKLSVILNENVSLTIEKKHIKNWDSLEIPKEIGTLDVDIERGCLLCIENAETLLTPKITQRPCPSGKVAFVLSDDGDLDFTII